MSDPFTDFMTRQTADRLARFDRVFYGFLYLGLAIGIVGIVAVMAFT